MSDPEILERLAEIDDDENVRLSSRDSEFMESMIRLREGNKDATLSPARRKWALDIISRCSGGD